MISKIHFISQEPHLINIEKALIAGCDWIQLRVKNKTEKEVLELALEARKICNQFKAKLIINDFPNIAKEAKADGLHLGLNDMQIKDARKIVGDKVIIGGTANTLEDVILRIKEQADYVGLGPLRFTYTKEKLSPILGFEGYKNIVTELKKMNLNIPLIAIGGVTENDIFELKKCGVYGVAFSTSLIKSSHPQQMIFNILTTFK